MNVEIDNRQTDLPLNEGKAAAVAKAVIELQGESADEVGVHFVSGEEIGQLHAQYFSDPFLTDVISLPIDNSYMFTGYDALPGGAGPSSLSLKEKRIAIAMGDDCKLRDEGPALTGEDATPVNMYDNSSPYRLLGDVFVCPKAALLYTEEKGGDPYWETTLYLVHGLLHLLGYDDKDDEAVTKMREAERRHMDHLKKTGALITS